MLQFSVVMLSDSGGGTFHDDQASSGRWAKWYVYGGKICIINTKKPSVRRTESFGSTNLALGELGSTTSGLQTVLR